MIRATSIAMAALFLVTYISSPSSGSTENTVGGVRVISSAEAPLIKGTMSLSLDLGANAQTGQFAIADILSYEGPQPTITAPDGWQLIRDDSTQTTRQSLYWHVVEPNDSNPASWTFSDPVDAQGTILLLDNVATDSPVDATSGNPGSTFSDAGGLPDESRPPQGYVSGLLTAKSVATTSDGDLVLAFNATDFGAYRGTACQKCDGLSPKLPQNATVVLNHESTALEYWILANYPNQIGETEVQFSEAPQFFNWVTAQVAIKRGVATP
jgi:hypothetical protein